MEGKIMFLLLAVLLLFLLVRSGPTSPAVQSVTTDQVKGAG